MTVLRRASCVTGLIAIAACTNVGTSPTTAVAIAFDTLPSPSVVYGDTLRNVDGAAAKLTAHAFNADGHEIPNAPIDYFLSDAAAASVSSDRFLIATEDTSKKSFTVRAQVNGIPSQNARTVDLVYRPDSVDRGTIALTKPETLHYAAADSVKTLDASLSIRVLNRPNPAKPDSAVRPVKSFLVKYHVVAPVGADPAKADTILVNDASVRSTVDTTSSDGIASRKIRFRFTGLTAVPDSVEVEATVRYRNALVTGAPIRFLIRVRKTG